MEPKITKRMHKTRERHHNHLALIIIIFAIIIAIGGYFAVTISYKNGKKDGREETIAVYTTKFNNLGDTVVERDKVRNALSALFTENDKSDETFANNLDKLIEETTDFDLKSLLTTYRETWQKYQNNEIDYTKFSEDSELTASAIQAYFDQKIHNIISSVI